MIHREICSTPVRWRAVLARGTVVALVAPVLVALSPGASSAVGAVFPVDSFTTTGSWDIDCAEGAPEATTNADQNPSTVVTSESTTGAATFDETLTHPTVPGVDGAAAGTATSTIQTQEFPYTPATGVGPGGGASVTVDYSLTASADPGCTSLAGVSVSTARATTFTVPIADPQAPAETWVVVGQVTDGSGTSTGLLLDLTVDDTETGPATPTLDTATATVATLEPGQTYVIAATASKEVLADPGEAASTESAADTLSMVVQIGRSTAPVEPEPVPEKTRILGYSGAAATSSSVGCEGFVSGQERQTDGAVSVDPAVEEDLTFSGGELTASTVMVDRSMTTGATCNEGSGLPYQFGSVAQDGTAVASGSMKASSVVGADGNLDLIDVSGGHSWAASGGDSDETQFVTDGNGTARIEKGVSHSASGGASSIRNLEISFKVAQTQTVSLAIAHSGSGFTNSTQVNNRISLRGPDGSMVPTGVSQLTPGTYIFEVDWSGVGRKETYSETERFVNDDGSAHGEPGPNDIYWSVTTTQETSTASTSFAMSLVFGPVTLVNTVKPKISGTPVVGRVLTATGGTWSSSDVTRSFRWLRNGSPIAGATASTYKPTTSDIGKSLSVRVTASKVGFVDGTATSAKVGPVKALSTLSVRVVKKTRVVIFKIAVGAAGVSLSRRDGTAAAFIGTNRIQRVSVVDGFATIKVPRRKRKTVYTLKYSGTSLIAVATRKVTVTA